MTPFSENQTSLADLRTYGVDVKDLMPNNSHREAWPVGVVDNSTDDHKVLNGVDSKAKAEAAKAKLLKKDDIRPAIKGQWPPGKYTDEHGKVIHYGHFDDGTDDDTVINAKKIVIDGVGHDMIRL